MKIEVKWDKPIEQMSYDKTGGDRGRLFLANEAKRLMDPYVPANNLDLAQKVRVYVENRQGLVHYRSPYAHYQYEGILYVSSRNGSAWARHGEHKVKSDPEKRLSHDKFRHPLATSHWDEAMLAARRQDLVRAYQSYLRIFHE